MEQERERSRRRETPVSKRPATRRDPINDHTRQSRSRTRRDESTGSRRLRSRSPVQDYGTPRQSRSHHGENEGGGEPSRRPRLRSRAPLRESGIRSCTGFLDRKRELERKQDKLKMLEIEIDQDLNSLNRSNSRRMSRDVDVERVSRQHKRSLHEIRNDDEPDIRQTRRRLSPSLSTKHVMNLINVLTALGAQSSNQPKAEASLSSSSLNHRNILPSFDPSSKNQRIDIWLKKVNECASVYGWDEKTIVHFAMQKLEGLAKTWYESLNSILFSWTEWQDKLRKAFPCEQNYGQFLEDMLRRKS